MPATAQVAVVMVNWRAAAMTVAAVEQVLVQTLPAARIYVVDNGSGDASVPQLREALQPYGERVILIANPRNDGFGSGCNVALRHMMADPGIDFAWLLNNDATPAPDCLAQLVAAAAAAPVPVGIVGSLLVDPLKASPPHFGSWLNPATLSTGALSPADPMAQHSISWMTAASMLVSVPALIAAGLFDEGFFMYWEDADLNQRIRQAGFSVVGAAGAVVEHHAGTSSAAIPVQRYLWHFASQDRFLAKHHPSPRRARATLRARYLLKAVIDRDLARFRALAAATLRRPSAERDAVPE